MEYGIGIYKKSEYISVKMPIFSFEKIKNADTSLGPEMKSTGEVLGISKVFSEAMLKGFLASGINIPYKGSVLITVKDKDKIETLPIAKKLESLGLKIYATSGTAQFLNENGVEAEPIVKIWEGEDNIINLIQEGKINFIINTPTKGKNESRDGFKIRRLAVESKIPCFTSLDTVSALYEALEKGVREEDLEPIDITKI